MKKVAPIIIVIIASAYLIAYTVILLFPIFSESLNSGIKIVLGFVALGMIGLITALIYTLRIRLKEIKEEEKNDLSKYWFYFR